MEVKLQPSFVLLDQHSDLSGKSLACLSKITAWLKLNAYFVSGAGGVLVQKQLAQTTELPCSKSVDSSGQSFCRLCVGYS